jgi:hypothetical protein
MFLPKIQQSFHCIIDTKLSTILQIFSLTPSCSHSSTIQNYTILNISILEIKHTH